MKLNFVLKRKTIYWIIGVGLIVISLLNFLSWFFLKSMKKEITHELKQQIIHLARMSTELINGNDLEKIMPGMENATLVRIYQQLLYDIKINNDLENIVILDLTGRLLVDNRIDYHIGDTLFTLPLNKNKFRSASLGETPDPIMIKSGNQYFLSAYIPINNDLDETIAVLVVDAPLNFFTTLRKFELGTLYIGISGLSILIFFSFIIVTATRQLFKVEARMKEQEKLVQLGQMAASVAHEIRNPLSIMKGTAEVLQKKYHSTQDEIFSFIPEEIDRLNRLVENFLQFARQRELDIRPHDIKQLIEDIARPIQNEKLSIQFNGYLPKVKVDADAFRQILLNLLNNAFDAINHDGKVIISVSLKNKKSGEVVIEVSDNGKGISKENLAKIFDPFFSTKAKGSGLGLAICKQLVELQRGSIKVNSTLGKGTKVSITLPTENKTLLKRK